jgi:crossover junction endodeoxyribonuclease RuvC
MMTPTRMPAPRILLGIDPGFADMGYGVIVSDGPKDRVVAFGSLKTSPKLTHDERLLLVYDGLAEIITTYQPEAVAIERLYFSKNVSTALDVAEARGVIRLCLRKHGVPMREFQPAAVKIAVCGSGNAEKSQVQKMTAMLLGLKEVPKPDDAADGLALAIALAHTVDRHA